MTKNDSYRIHKGDFYFKTHDGARAWAEDHDFPTNLIREYQLGYAIQLHTSGPYAGPELISPSQHKPCQWCNWRD